MLAAAPPSFVGDARALRWFRPPNLPSSPGSGGLQPARNYPPTVVPSRSSPRGIRSFDSDDADFFLELLPGPRDRNGLPAVCDLEIPREKTDPDRRSRLAYLRPLGLLREVVDRWLMKAGNCCPAWPPAVLAVYVEATAGTTPKRGCSTACGSVAALTGQWEASDSTTAPDSLVETLAAESYRDTGFRRGRKC